MISTALNFKHWLLLPAFALVLSCTNDVPQQLTPHQIRHVRKAVNQLTASIARDVTAKGPIAWTDYFDNSPNFFMANNGQLAFQNYASAQKFIRDTLVKSITKITLRWGAMRIDPLSSNIAAIGSQFHEDLTIVNAKPLSIDGYFTAMAVLDNNQWKLRNAHWSVKGK